jgi:succinoglycan biosynthesis transport protein ExoP
MSMANQIVARNAMPTEMVRYNPTAVGPLAETGELDLRGMFRTVYRHKLMLTATIVVGLAATQLWIANVTPYYSADALVVVDNRPSHIVVVDANMPSLSSRTTEINTEVAVLKSRAIAAKVIEQLKLQDDPEFAPAPPDAAPSLTQRMHKYLADLWAESPIAPVITVPLLNAAPITEDGGETRRRAELLDNFLHRLTVKAEDQSRLIAIQFESTDAVKAALIVNTLVDTYIRSQLETKTEGARQAAIWLEGRLGELGGTVGELETSVQKRRSAVGLVKADGVNGTNAAVQRLTQLNIELARTKAARATLEARYQRVKAAVNRNADLETLPEVIVSPTIQDLRTKVATLRTKLDELSSRFGPRYQDVIDTRAMLATVERQMRNEIRVVLDGLANQVASAAAEESELTRQLKDTNGEVAKLDDVERDVGQMTRQLTANRELYQNLLKQYTEIVALRDNLQPDARVISAAQVPLGPSFPRKSTTFALAGIGSVGFAFLLVSLAERLRIRFDRPEDVERELGLRVLEIPDLPRLRRMMTKPSDYVEREPLSAFGTAFQRLRAILALDNDRQMPGKVLVTSATADEGKTTICVCLGIASVSSGQNVLIIDTDFHNPNVHRMLGVDNAVGLSELLSGQTTLDEALIRVSPGLAVLPAGRIRGRTIDMLKSGTMARLLAELERDFDLIILDSAPVLSLSDSLVLGGLADKTLLVTSRNYTTHKNAGNAAAQLQRFGADISAVLFNRADVPLRTYGR